MLAALGVLVFLVFLGVRRLHAGFVDAGFTKGEATTILVVAPILGLVHVPLGFVGASGLAVNVGGAIVPLLVSAKLVLEERAPRARTALATAFVTVAAFGASFVVEGEGVRVALLVPVALAALLGVAFTLGNLRKAGPLAYVAGTLGILIGADLLRLADLGRLAGDGRVASIGGAGAFDAVFLVGVVAVGLHLLLWSLAGRR